MTSDRQNLACSLPIYIALSHCFSEIPSVVMNGNFGTRGRHFFPNRDGAMPRLNNVSVLLFWCRYFSNLLSQFHELCCVTLSVQYKYTQICAYKEIIISFQFLQNQISCFHDTIQHSLTTHEMSDVCEFQWFNCHNFNIKVDLLFCPTVDLLFYVENRYAHLRHGITVNRWDSET